MASYHMQHWMQRAKFATLKTNIRRGNTDYEARLFPDKLLSERGCLIVKFIFGNQLIKK